jgi:imidazolonepropionase-like amidohydrolase/Tol biopolymer transport system component
MKPKTLAIIFIIIFIALNISLFGGENERIVAVEKGAQDPVVSPDGSKIAVSILGKIWLVPAAGGAARQVTTGLGWDTHPAWSSDGQFLAYAHSLPQGTDLAVLNFSTGNTRVLTHVNFGLGQIGFHPAGKDIYYLVDQSQYDCHLWSIPLDGGEAKQLTLTEGWHEWSFAFSPDGEKMILDQGRYGGSDLYLMNLKDGATTRLTNTPAHEFSACWTADGKNCVYLKSENGVDFVVVMAAENGTPREVFSSPYSQKQLALFPDGKGAVICSARTLWRIDLESGVTTPLSFKASFGLAPQTAPNLLITNARLFDGTGSDAQSNVTIEVRNGRIAAIHKGQVPATQSANIPVLDAAGKTLLPGLMDNHYHYWNAFDGSSLLMHGITSIRDPGTAISTFMNFKEAINNGILEGPDIFGTGPLIDGWPGYHPAVDVELTKPEVAAPLVRALKAQGVDAIKVYFMLNPAVLKAVVAEAKKLGLPTTAHIGVRTSWGEAVDFGINGLCHIRVWKDFLPPELQPNGENETLDFQKNMVGRMQSDWRGIDPKSPAVQALLEKIAKNNVALDPTLAGQNVGDTHKKMLGFEQYAAAKESYEKMKQFIRRAYESGATILAGTDNGSLFEELEAYAEAGIPNKGILQSVTALGAKWLGKSADFGTIEVGKRANLILVDGDPLKDIKELRKITLVVKDGRIVFKKS